MKYIKNNSVFAMSKRQKDLLDDINNSAYQVYMNLIKIYVFRDELTVSHWKHELVASLSHIPSLKSSKKYLNHSAIYRALTTDEDKRLNKLFRAAISEEQTLQPIIFIPSDNLESFIHEYIRWLSAELEDQGIVVFSDASKTIDKLLHKYLN